MIRIIEFATGFQTDELPGTAVDASTITVEPSGDLLSTDLQSALVELQGDIDVSEAAHAAHLANSANPHAVTKSQVGLANVDNTSDANKPISTATQTALNLKADASATTASLALKADASAVTSSLALKLAKANDTATGLTIGDQTDFTQVATPSAPAAGKTRVYSKTDGKIYKQTPAGLESEIGAGGGLSGVAKTANYTGNINEMVEADPTAAAFTVTCPTIPAAGGSFGVLDASEAASATKYIRVTPATGQSIGNLPVNDSYLIDYARGSLILYAAPGATSWKVQYQATSMIAPGLQTGLTSGATIGTGYIGEKIVGTNVGASLASSGLTYNTYQVVLPAGVYMVYGKLSVSPGGTSQTDFNVTLSTSSGTQNALTQVRDLSTSTTLNKFVAPAPLYYNGTGTTVYMTGNASYTGTAPAVQTGSSELYAIRIA